MRTNNEAHLIFVTICSLNHELRRAARKHSCRFYASYISVSADSFFSVKQNTFDIYKKKINKKREREKEKRKL